MLARINLRNELLRSLPLDERAVLSNALERVDLERRRVLVQTGLPVGHVYFPETALVCACCRGVSGPPMEVGVIGRFGFVGMSLLLGASHSPIRLTTQISGQALRMEATAFKTALDQLPEFRRTLLRFVNAFQFQQSQLLFCNARHSVEQRVARWLLLAARMIGSCEIRVTHELIARLLGTRRASVSGAVAAIAGQGLLDCHRGVVRIVDWPALNAAACPCGSLILAEHARIHPVPPLEAGSPNRADGTIRVTRKRRGGRATEESVVLVVEDEFFVGEAIVQALKSKGRRILGPITQVPDALRLVASAGQIDAAVVDFRLGDQTAVPVIQALRGRGVPFALATGYSPADIPAEYRDVPWLRKPFSMSDLGATMARLLRAPSQPRIRQMPSQEPIRASR